MFKLVNLTLPQVTLPQVTLPQVTLPQVTLLLVILGFVFCLDTRQFYCFVCQNSAILKYVCWCTKCLFNNPWLRYDVYQNLKKTYDWDMMCIRIWKSLPDFFSMTTQPCASAQVLPLEAIFVATVTFKKTTVEPLYNSSLGEKGAIVKR